MYKEYNNLNYIGNQYIRILSNIEKTVTSIWAPDAPRIIRDYTDHGIEHIRHLFKWEDELLQANYGRKLTKKELFVLLASTYLHDIGMQCDVIRHPEIKERAIQKGAEFDCRFTASTAGDFSLTEQIAIRKNHHYLSAAWIEYAYETGETVLGKYFNSENASEVQYIVPDVSDTCMYHSKLDINECPINFSFYNNERKQFVAALLRFADELDIQRDRVNIQVIRNFRLDLINSIFWVIHHQTIIDIFSNKISITILLNPDDMDIYSSILNGYIEKFIEKNDRVVSVLADNKATWIIDKQNSKVIQLPSVERIPDNIGNFLEEAMGMSIVTTIKTILSNIWSHEIADFPGVGSLKQVFYDNNLSDRVFSVELLTKPLKLELKNNNIIVSIDRENVTQALYTTGSKKRVVERCFGLEKDSPEMIQRALENPHKYPLISEAITYEKRIHDFLLMKENSENPFILPLDKFPLRWASGGVFPVVNYRGNRYSLFFFRDIAPCGWNIPLGASELTDNLQCPWDFMWREFLEELLVLRQEPSFQINDDGTMNKQELEYKKVTFSDNRLLYPPARLACEFSENHRELRKNFDNLTLIESIDSELRLDFPQQRLNNSLEIILQSNIKSTFDNVLVAINPLEIGIEIVAVVEINLDYNDYILDGEILKPQNKDHELVRMPVALISHEYLMRIFTADWDLWNNSRNGFRIGYDIPINIENVPKIPKKEIIVFDWDMRRRRAILSSEKGVGYELTRYENWIKNFNRFANATSSDLREQDIAPALFTPTSAKIASYYFAQRERFA